MNRKIELIQDEENLGLWHWVILEYNENEGTWFNSAHGLEISFEEAVSKVKKEYFYL